MLLRLSLFFAFHYGFEAPWARLLSAMLLIYMCVRFVLYLRPAMVEGQHAVVRVTYGGALGTIIVADCILALGNIAALYGVHQPPAPSLIPHLSELTVFRLTGLALTLLMIAVGSSVTNVILRKFPRSITLFALFLGWLAGELIYSDPAVVPTLSRIAAQVGLSLPTVQIAFSAGSALLVVCLSYVLGGYLRRHHEEAERVL
jgi:predicted tellurium resistance membrane protein TerC